MRIITRVFGLRVFQTDVEGKSGSAKGKMDATTKVALNVPAFTLVSFPGIRTKFKTKGPFGITLGKTKGWLAMPFDLKTGPIEGEITGEIEADTTLDGELL